MSKFKEALDSGKFLVTVELKPPKGVNTEPFLKTVDALVKKVDALNVPDNRSASMALGPLPASMLVKERGGEPICTFTCRDRNRMAISSDVLGAYALGIENILLVSGDYFTFGDTLQAKPVFDLDSVQAIQMVRALEEGKDIGGNDLDGSPRFCLGGVANPQANPLQPQFIKYLKKVRAGVDFIQTLDVYDLKKMESFMEQAKKESAKVIAGIRLVGKDDARLQKEGKLSGNLIPKEWLDEIRDMDEEKALEAGKKRAVELIKSIKDKGLANGVHITAEQHEEVIPEILSAAGL
jgi:5,10-methylenetetrahydrofolate reductase